MTKEIIKEHAESKFRNNYEYLKMSFNGDPGSLVSHFCIVSPFIFVTNGY